MTTSTGKVPKRADNLKGGSRKGRPNKTTAQLKDMILKALDGAGGVEYLERRANDPRTASAFLTLIGKVLPMQVANAEGEAFKTENKWTIEFVRAKANAS